MKARNVTKNGNLVVNCIFLNLELLFTVTFTHPLPPSLSRATEAISYLDRVHQQKKEGVKPSSPYLRLILEQARYTSQPNQEQELLKLIPSVSGAHLHAAVFYPLLSHYLPSVSPKGGRGCSTPLFTVFTQHRIVV